MRKVTQQIVGAFENRYAAKLGNTHTDGKTLWLHGNAIAKWLDDGLYITNAGWRSNTTKERLNGLRGVNISQKNYTWYLNGKEWNGEWINVATGVQSIDEPAEKLYTEGSHLKQVAGIMALGEVFGKTKKQKNDWKTRMLKAGLEGRGLIMPEDWDELSEADKEARLNGAIGALS